MARPGTDEVRILVPGEPEVIYPLFAAGGFIYTLPKGATQIACEVENRLGRRCRRIIDLEGDPPPSAVDPVGRTIFWTSYHSETEIAFDITSMDVKGKIAGRGNLYLPDDPNDYPMETLKGKIATKPKLKGRKFKLAMKSSSDPKRSVKIAGWMTEEGLVHTAKVKIKVKKIMKESVTGVQFQIREDNGNPLSVSEVKVSGVAEDSRAGSEVLVETDDDEFRGESPVSFTQTLEQIWGLQATITADDDAAPSNRRTRSLWARIDWEVPE